MVERRFLQHWQQERAARAKLRESLPPSWRDDPRPKMAEVREHYIEAMLELRRPSADADDGR